MIYKLSFDRVAGLPEQETDMLRELTDVYNQHIAKNKKKEKYYEGKISVADVNLGLALPKQVRGLEIGCAWGAKTVDVLASRSMFDGFVGQNGRDAALMDRIVKANGLITQYNKSCRDELKYGCTFATLSADPVLGCRVRFHTPLTAAAVWDGERGRLAYGLAIVDIAKDATGRRWAPSIVNLYTDDAIWQLYNVDNEWRAHYYPHKMGRPLMVPMPHRATSSKPFGLSRLKAPIRHLIEGYVRTVANASIGLEFSTAPQKYLLGITDDQYDAVINDKFRSYVGSIIAATTNPETGEKPTFGQLTQGTITPHVEMMRLLATQFSAATGLSVTDTGVINDANPTSSDAILAQSQSLVSMAEELNTANGDALYTISQMAQAIARNVTLDDLTDEERDIIAHFKNPAMPSVAATADAALKIASCRPGFANTDVFLEMVGFDQADIRRIRNQESRSRGLQLVEELVSEEVTADDDGEA